MNERKGLIFISCVFKERGLESIEDSVCYSKACCSLAIIFIALTGDRHLKFDIGKKRKRRFKLLCYADDSCTFGLGNVNDGHKLVRFSAAGNDNKNVALVKIIDNIGEYLMLKLAAFSAYDKKAGRVSYLRRTLFMASQYLPTFLTSAMIALKFSSDTELGME